MGKADVIIDEYNGRWILKPSVLMVQNIVIIDLPNKYILSTKTKSCNISKPTTTSKLKEAIEDLAKRQELDYLCFP